MNLPDAAREILQDSFSQSDILDSWGFSEFLRAREIWIDETYLERLEREGLLRPLFRRKSEQKSSPYQLTADSVEFPEPGDYKPWPSRNRTWLSPRVFYHPAQALLIDKFLPILSLRIEAIYLKEIEAEKVIESYRELYASFKLTYLANLPALEKRIALLLQLETPYKPLYRKRMKMGFPHTWDVKDWLDWKAAFKAKDLLARADLTVGDIAQWRDILALTAYHFLDPMGPWYMLTRLVKYSKKTKLKGQALRANDYYEHVALLNFFLEDLTGEPQKEPYEIADGSDGNWRKRIYGDNFDLDSVETQRKILDEYIFSDDRLLTKLVLVVEGHCEEQAIQTLCHAIGWDFEKDLLLMNLQGVGGLENLRTLLKSTKQDKVQRYVIVDSDPGVQESIQRLLDECLLESQDVTIWKANFEEDNFSEEDILKAVNEMLVDYEMSVTKEDLASLRSDNKRVMETLKYALFAKYGQDIWSVISKPKLTGRLIAPRLQEITEEVKAGRYAPKLELEKILGLL